MAYNFYQDLVTKDLVIENNNFKLTAGNTEFISQKIENEFLFFLGEYWLDVSQGIPYRSIENKDRDNPTKNIVGIKNPDINYINSVFVLALSGIEGIDQIIDLTSNYNNINRKLLINYTVRITTGEIIVNQVGV